MLNISASHLKFLIYFSLPNYYEFWIRFEQTNLHFDYMNSNEMHGLHCGWVWLYKVRIAVNRKCWSLFCVHMIIFASGQSRKKIYPWLNTNQRIFFLAVGFQYANCVFGYFTFGLYLNNSMCCTELAADPKMWFHRLLLLSLLFWSSLFFRWLYECARNLCMRIFERILCVETVLRVNMKLNRWTLQKRLHSQCLQRNSFCRKSGRRERKKKKSNHESSVCEPYP